MDLRIVGPDAEPAARTYDRQSLTYLYDIPPRGVGDIRSGFEALVRERGLDAECWTSGRTRTTISSCARSEPPSARRVGSNSPAPRVLGMMTSWGDGIFPLEVDTAVGGAPAAVRVDLGPPDHVERLNGMLDR